MKKIIYTFLIRPVTVLMLFFSVLVIGIVSFFNIPVELVPQIESPKLSITAYWNGVSPEAVEEYLTSPLESVLSGIKGLKKISSRSSEGTVNIDLEFHPNINIQFSRLEINEKLGAIIEELPYGISRPKISAYIPKEFRDLQGFLTYTLTSDLPAGETKKYAVDHIKTPLLAVDGVSDVLIRGGNDREILITIDNEKAKSLNISSEDIANSINGTGRFVTAGTIRINDHQFQINIDNELNSPEVLFNQPVKISHNSVIRLKDIGTVTDDFSEPNNYYRINGREAVFIQIDKEQGKNSIKVADNIYNKINELGSNLPPGFKFTKETDMSLNIRDEIGELFRNSVYSVIIIILVLIVFFRRITYSFIIITSIIFSLLFAIIIFFVFNIPLNLLTIASLILGFGLMIDNSVVVVDYLDKHNKSDDLKRLSVHSKNIFFPNFAATLTTIAVFIPLVFLTGELKMYFGQFALSIAITLSISLLVSYSLVPLLFARDYSAMNNFSNKTGLFTGKFIPESGQEYVLQKIILAESGYTYILRKIYRWKKAGIVFLILTIGLPVWLLPARIEFPVLSPVYNSIFDSELYSKIKKHIHLAFGGSLNLFFNHIEKGEVFAYGDTDYLIVSLRLPNGNKVERLNKLTRDFENEVLAYRRNIKDITSNVFNEENAIIKINFTRAQTGTAFPYILKNYLTAYAVGLGGLEVSVYGFGPGFFSGSAASTSSFTVETTGYNYKGLKALADKFKKIITQNSRVDNIDIDKSIFNTRDGDTYEIIARVNRESLAGYDIPIKNLFENISNRTSGNLKYSKLRFGKEEVLYSIKNANYRNIQLEELKNFIVKTPANTILKIKDVVNFEESKVLSTISRENQQYIRNISFDFKGPYQYGNEIVKSIINKMDIPAGYSVKQQEFSFLFGKDDELKVWQILAVSILIIFMITASLFESLKLPFLIILSIPFAFVGTIILFYFGEYNLDRGAYAGLLLLIGLAVNNSILLVDYLAKNYMGEGFDRLIELSYKRVRPIFTTTLTTVAAMSPLLLTEGNSFWKSLSLSVTGGLLFSSLFVVLVIPVLFFVVSKKA